MGTTTILEMARAYGLRPRLWLLVLLHINLSNFESVLNWRNWNKFWRVCMGCYQTLIPYISIGNCNSELIFGMRASFRILYKNMTSYPIISKILFLWRHHFRTLLGSCAKMYQPGKGSMSDFLIVKKIWWMGFHQDPENCRKSGCQSALQPGTVCQTNGGIHSAGIFFLHLFFARFFFSAAFPCMIFFVFSAPSPPPSLF